VTRLAPAPVVPARVVPALSALAAVAMLGACRTESIITTDPPGATVEIDGQRGVTPFTVSLAVTTFGSYPMRIEKTGFVTYEGEVSKEANANSIVGGVFCPPLWLGIWNRAKPMTSITLQAIEPFPEAFTREQPSEPILPPLPPGMDPVKYKGNHSESQPARDK
jgi:PEGA domain-containing protein